MTTLIESAKDVCTFGTVKVLIAAATPYVVWLTNLELALKVLAAAGAVVYIILRIGFLIVRKGKE